MLRTVFCSLAVCDLGVTATRSLAVDDITYTLIPIGGTTITGGQTVDVELFLTAHRALQSRGTQYDLPCVVTADPGGSGALTLVSATANPDGDGLNGPSSGGVPFLSGGGGVGTFAPSTCIFFAGPPIGIPSFDLPAGALRYLGTITYQADDCAAGTFRLSYECTDQPGGLCDNAPEPTNTTRHREVVPGMPMGALVSLQLTQTTVTVPTGPCCASDVVVPDRNTYCCEVVENGCSHFRTAPTGCVPATYADIYPPQTGGDGLIDSDDILCALYEFTSPGSCPSADIAPCGLNGVFDVDDILAVVDSFSGAPPCPDPCE